MSWQKILENDQPNRPLRQRIDSLFAQQRETWLTLKQGEEALSHLRRKTLLDGGQSVLVQANPARRRSTLAKTDAKTVAARACFLCPENMPIEERGVAFENLVVLPNPYPILPWHCTIASREHRPQQLEVSIDRFLRLSAAIGPDLASFYNGPRCGASAPDHFHFQAARADGIPILDQLPTLSGTRPVVAHASFGRPMLVFHSSKAVEMQANIEDAIKALRRVEETTDEPMLNVIAHYEADCYTAVLFPRALHRPACYFADGPDQLLISPAILEMSGILVTSEPDHFDRIDASTARAVYEEVSLNVAEFERVLASLQ